MSDNLALAWNEAALEAVRRTRGWSRPSPWRRAGSCGRPGRGATPGAASCSRPRSSSTTAPASTTRPRRSPSTGPTGRPRRPRRATGACSPSRSRRGTATTGRRRQAVPRPVGGPARRRHRLLGRQAGLRLGAADHRHPLPVRRPGGAGPGRPWAGRPADQGRGLAALHRHPAVPRVRLGARGTRPSARPRPSCWPGAPGRTASGPA
jgi:hypothetical protein